MTLDEAMAMASRYAQQREFDSAQNVLQQILAVVPDNPEALHCLGVVLTNKGERQGGFDAMLQAARLSPQTHFLYPLLKSTFNCRAFEALDHLCAEFKTYILNDIQLLPIWVALHIWRNENTAALALIDVGLRLVPDHSELLHHASVALLRLGRHEEAIQAFAKRTTPYVRQERNLQNVRDAYAGLAPSYDANTLHQTFSRTLLELVAKALPDLKMNQVLELGCGTGVMSDHLPKTVTKLVGVDISSDMLDVARQKQAYTQLICGDLMSVLSGYNDRFDTVLSSGVLYHIDDLTPIFEECCRILHPGGVFAFSVDPMTDDQDIAVSCPGEYCHSRAYLRKLAQQAGFTEIAMEIQMHRAAPGFWCVFQKS